MAATKQQLVDSLWVEKYRPKALADIAMPEEYRNKFQEFISSGTIPHLLLEGSAGTGKTTCARLLVNSLDCEWELMNASDERGIDVIRGAVKNFARVSSMKPLKVMVLDESDALTPDAQFALRNTLEQFSKNTRFILTCNYVNKIIEPLQSRCQVFHFSAMPKEEVLAILEKILKAENIGYDLNDLKKHAELYYPDLRKAINEMQKNISSRRFVYREKRDTYKKIIDAMLKKDLKEVRIQLVNNSVDYPELYRYVYDNVKLFPQKAWLQIMLDAAEYLWRDSSIPDQEMNFAAFSIQVFKQL